MTTALRTLYVKTVCIAITCSREDLELKSCHFFFFVAQQFPVGQGLLIIEALRSYSDTTQSVRLHWTSEQPEAETST